MRNGTSGSKRKATSSETDVPAKRSADVAVPEEVLRKLASALNAATLALMDLPSTDVAARGRVVAVMAACKRQINNVLGVKRRGACVLAISDVIIDVFQFVRRQELDTLQIVSRRFNAVVEKKLTLVCLRQLKSAKVSRCSAENQFVLLMAEVDAKKMTRLLTGVDDEAAATTLLLNACQSSRVDSLELYGTTPMSGDFFDSLALRAQTIFVKDFCMGRRTLSDAVSNDDVLRVLQAFAEVRVVESDARKDANLQSCLIRTCYKAGVDLHLCELDKKCDTTMLEDALLEFCFGECDEQYATRDRYLDVEVSKSPRSDFLQRLIEMAEVHNCRHKLTLNIWSWQGLLRQDIGALDVYKRSQTEWERRLKSVSGRHWKATYGSEQITFKVNH
ncbi:hypothetical protein AAVH_23505 [Aphelenchoides avenae]|nr:hypothetical protein AAVH_23505 [Aphelenchus avenae]